MTTYLHPIFPPGFLFPGHYNGLLCVCVCRMLSHPETHSKPRKAAQCLAAQYPAAPLNWSLKAVLSRYSSYSQEIALVSPRTSLREESRCEGSLGQWPPLQNMANKSQHQVPAPLVHGAEAASPTCLCVLGPTVQRTETLRSCLCSFMSTQSWLTSVSCLQLVSHFCWAREGAGG